MQLVESGNATDNVLCRLYERPSVFVRKLKKSEYAQLLEQYTQLICKWTDP